MRRTKSRFITITIRYDDVDVQLSEVFNVSKIKLRKLQLSVHLGAKRLPACEPRHSGSRRRGSALLFGDPLFFQGHAANRSGQEEQSGIPGA